MKDKKIALTAVLLVIMLVNYTLTTSDGSIRTVEFLSIFAIGTLFGVLLHQILSFLKRRGANKEGYTE